MRLFGLGRKKQPSNSLTTAEVELCCRLMLGRAPNGRERRAAAGAASLDALRDILLESEDAQALLSPAVANAETKPLLLIGFPRGFTSQSYFILQAATGLREILPNDGEILNLQRVKRLFPFVDGRMGFYDTSEPLYEKVAETLGHVRKGCIVKDVVQPFHVLRYLDANPDTFNVIYVKRDLRHVAFAVIRREWGYVHRVAELHDRFSKYPSLDVERALTDFRYPADVVRSLGYVARPHDYRDAKFRQAGKEFDQRFAAESGTFDLDGLIANSERRDVVARFGTDREAYVPKPPPRKPGPARAKRLEAAAAAAASAPASDDSRSG